MVFRVCGDIEFGSVPRTALVKLTSSSTRDTSCSKSQGIPIFNCRRYVVFVPAQSSDLGSRVCIREAQACVKSVRNAVLLAELEDELDECTLTLHLGYPTEIQQHQQQKGDYLHLHV